MLYNFMAFLLCFPLFVIWKIINLTNIADLHSTNIYYKTIGKIYTKILIYVNNSGDNQKWNFCKKKNK